jgi:membrane protein DedA with SNARE-associated domain
MPDSAVVAPTRPRPGGRTLTYLTIPIVGFIILSNVGDAMAPSLVNDHPLLLLAMNARNRNVLLVTNQLDAVSYYVVGTIRLLISDPLFFLVGYWYGDAAIVWMERRTKTLGQTLRQWEGWFSKAAYPVLFLFPNQYICLFAGAAGMELAGFLVVNVTGTLARLYLLRWLGDAFDAPIQSVLDFIGDHRTPLLVLSIGLAVVFTLTELRKGGADLEEIEEIEGELEASADGSVDTDTDTDSDSDTDSDADADADADEDRLP